MGFHIVVKQPELAPDSTLTEIASAAYSEQYGIELYCPI